MVAGIVALGLVGMAASVFLPFQIMPNANPKTRDAESPLTLVASEKRGRRHAPPRVAKSEEPPKSDITAAPAAKEVAIVATTDPKPPAKPETSEQAAVITPPCPPLPESAPEKPMKPPPAGQGQRENRRAGPKNDSKVEEPKVDVASTKSASAGQPKTRTRTGCSSFELKQQETSKLVIPGSEVKGLNLVEFEGADRRRGRSRIPHWRSRPHTQPMSGLSWSGHQAISPNHGPWPTSERMGIPSISSGENGARTGEGSSSKTASSRSRARTEFATPC